MRVYNNKAGASSSKLFLEKNRLLHFGLVWLTTMGANSTKTKATLLGLNECFVSLSQVVKMF